MTTFAGELLVAAPVGWDEACFLVPVVRAFKAAGQDLGILCTEDQVVFWEKVRCGPVIGYQDSEKPKSLAERLGVWKSALVWEKGVAAGACVKAKIPRRIGPEIKELVKYITHPVGMRMEPGPVEHRVRHYLRVAEKLGVPTRRIEWFLPLDPESKPAPETVLLCPDSDFGPTHEWPLAKWEALADKVRASGGRLKVVGFTEGRGPGRELSERLGVEYLGIGRLGEALEVFAAHAWMISVENSAVHVAAMAGVTCVTLFGPGDPNWRRPMGRHHGVVRRHVECAPCFLRKCPMDLRCQHELTVDKVFEAVRLTVSADFQSLAAAAGLPDYVRGREDAGSAEERGGLPSGC